MVVAFAELLADLRAETRVVEDMLTGLSHAAWDAPTPAAGWAIRDQVSHLAYFDEAATRAAVDPDRFRAVEAKQVSRNPAFADEVAQRHRGLPPAELSTWFRDARRRLVDTASGLDPKLRVPWYGPEMSLASSITARLMETWAHGQDIADTLGVERAPTVRLRHVAHLGVRTFGFVFGLHGRPVAADPVRVELTGPDGATWTWGPPRARDTVSGPALDFCLVVTQRRHVADTALEISGPVAAEWMSIAQAFAGLPGPGRAPGELARKETTVR
ncbi:TIGR03084 family metal-binding protein [Prauserella muralis]|uniref:TIGR03084 family protein n=1 Tax=Prauserella muralis TaxID=588067 RepID=A0A2V4AF42_9PSEU|nr:TIGR03084 family metal-binding protein [Prauserella muralis]PXY17446.1 TIGR03084 family protein [Prauserella muralis]TWE23618.1 uncharacterized protein (TIGR03084 family) [Prauserella muralis]